MKIGVWHGEKHDDATVTEVEVSDLHRWIEQKMDDEKLEAKS